MNLRDLRYVIAVADAGHFGRAAERCHVSQPTLSGQVAKLEEQLGVTLFERLPRQIRITEAGAELIARARAVVWEADAMIEHAKMLQNPLRGRFRLGLIPTVGPYLLPHILKPLHAALPELEILPVERQSADCITALERGELDAAILALPYPEADRFSVVPLFDEAFELALSKEHPLANSKRDATAADLEEGNLLLLEHGHCLREHALSFCQLKSANEGLKGTSLETLRNLVAINMGVTLIPELAARAVNNADVVMKHLKPPAPGRRIALLSRKTSPRQSAINAILDVVLDLALPLRGIDVAVPD